MSDIPDLTELNATEILQILAKPAHGGHRVSKSLPIQRLASLLREGDAPRREEIAMTVDSRRRLEKWVEKRWKEINSQIPCTGRTRGLCTIYQCSEGQHLQCLLDAEEADEML